MTAIANPDLSDIDLITMKRLRLMSSLSVAIFGLMGLGFFIILHDDETAKTMVHLIPRRFVHVWVIPISGRIVFNFK